MQEQSWGGGGVSSLCKGHCQDVHCLEDGGHGDHYDHGDDGDHDDHGDKDGDNIVRRLPSRFNFVEECILADGQPFKKTFVLFEIVQRMMFLRALIQNQ